METEGYDKNIMEKEQSHNSLVSVIIPVYNVAPYIREALDSVVNQTYRNLEIIIVDDGSTDGSGAICDEYKTDPRVKVIHQENGGPSLARNVGLDLATGDFITFLDSDDAYHLDFIRLMLGAIEKADIVQCQFTRHQLSLDSKGEIALAAREGFYDRVKALQALFEGIFTVHVYIRLYRKKLWDHIRFPVGYIHEDRYVAYQIFDACNNLYFLNQTLYFRRIRPGSITTTASRKNIVDENLSYEWVYDFVEAHYPEVFSEVHVRNARQSRLNRKILACLNGNANIDEVKSACKGANLNGFSFKSQMAYQILCHSPWLLKVIYPVYRSLRNLVYKS